VAGGRRPALWNPKVRMEERADGSILVWREDPLDPYTDKLNARFLHWAKVAPDRPWMAQRNRSGGWRTLSYREARGQIEAIGQALLATMCAEPQDHAGNLGVPARGVVLKLAPQGDKLEARIKGPNVTPPPTASPW
jgi:long-subunit acyl-CoA synthetase (AMP-forming)